MPSFDDLNEVVAGIINDVNQQVTDTVTPIIPDVPQAPQVNNPVAAPTPSPFISKPFVYDLLTRNGARPFVDSVQQSPAAVVGVLRLKYRNTFDFNAQRSFQFDGLNASPEYSVAQLGDIVQIQDRIISVSVTSSKSSHTDSMSVTCVDPDNKLMKNIAPGDWIMCWMCDNKADAQLISQKLDSETDCNDFLSGLKFIGKVQSIVKSVNVDADGTKTRSVNINALMFKELDSAIYFDPLLVRQDELATMSFLAGLTGDLDSLAKSDDPLKLEIGNRIAAYISIFLGDGPPNNELSTDPVALQANAPRSPNTVFTVPVSIGRILSGSNPPQTGKYIRYSDILRSIIGVQEYSGSSFQPNFSPVTTRNGLDKRTTIDMDGKIQGYVAPFNNTPIWQIIQSALNPVVNEMYSCLRVTSDNKIFPHLIIRQMPFTTDQLKTQDQKSTAFFELPRWKVSPEQVLSLEVGRTEALRVNMAQVLISIPLPNMEHQSQEEQRTQNPATLDILDIERNGLKPYFASSNVENTNTSVGSNLVLNKRWSRLVADKLMAGHLRYTGSIVLKGIQEPICIGDNLEFNGIVYHIETVSHTVNVTPDGDINFNTVLSLTNGLNASAKTIDELWPELANNTADDAGPTGGID